MFRLQALSQAFTSQRPESKDVLLSLSLDGGPTRDLTGAVLSLLPTGEVADSIVGGGFGRNMLSVSTALTRLPLSVGQAGLGHPLRLRAEAIGLCPGCLPELLGLLPSGLERRFRDVVTARDSEDKAAPKPSEGQPPAP